MSQSLLKRFHGSFDLRSKARGGSRGGGGLGSGVLFLGRVAAYGFAVVGACSVLFLSALWGDAAPASSAALLQAQPLQRPHDPGNVRGFRRLASSETGVALVYQFPKDAPMELLQDQGAGGGVCLADFDGDQWPDLFLTHYHWGNRFYRNLGGMRFEDRTEAARVGGVGRWCGGVTPVDVDNDGDLDVFVAVFDGPNLLLINDGKGVFDEQAAAWGLAFRGASVMMAFADYDRDGWLDGYLVTHRLSVGNHRLPRNTRESFSRSILQLDRLGRPKVQPPFEELFVLLDKGGSRAELSIAGQRDLLFRHGGAGARRFLETTRTAGMVGADIGLAAAWWDYNGDGWPDLYVSNDYKGPDRLYENRRDGTFREVAAEVLPHTPWSSMGTDSADVNNDGWMDFLATDMAGTSHARRMRQHDDLEKDRWFLSSAKPAQYARNALYLGHGGTAVAEAAFLAGLARTDWTWSPKFGDYDNDGWVDVFFTTGMSRDFFDADRLKQTSDRQHPGWRSAPPLLEPNLALRNLGNLRFEAVGARWGLDQVSASFGAAVSDLDRDGDLDLVVMNFEEPISLYRNEHASGHSVLVRLQGQRSNRSGIGARVRVQSASGTQWRTLTLASGYMSANEPVLHFGLGPDRAIARLTVSWPSGLEQSFESLAADQFYTITEGEGAATPEAPPEVPWLERSGPWADLRHSVPAVEEESLAPWLPVALSSPGPGLAVGDANGDGRDDVFVTGLGGGLGRLFLHDGRDRLVLAADESLEGGPLKTAQSALWVDVDADGDLDLLLASSIAPAASAAAVALYSNDGRGRLTLADASRVARSTEPASALAAGDIDRDGDLDVFFGGPAEPARYPNGAGSRLLLNVKGRLVEAPAEMALGLDQMTGVTSALWTDVDDDGWLDLWLTRSWGSSSWWVNQQGRLVERTAESGLGERTGWWQGVIAGDFDADGDLDYFVSNRGLNTPYAATPERPCLAFAGALDGTGRVQMIEGIYEGDRLVPVRSRAALTAAFPALAARFATAAEFAAASLADFVGADVLRQARVWSVNTMESGLWRNLGGGKLTFEPLPRLAQIAPAFGAVAWDANGDGHLDLALVQNTAETALDLGRFHGGLGLLLAGDGRGGFRPVPLRESGWLIPGEGRSVALTDVNQDGHPDLLVGVRQEAPTLFRGAAPPGRAVPVRVVLRGHPGNPTAVGARVRVTWASGRTQAAEIAAGHGCWSQGTTALALSHSASHAIARLEVRWPRGQRTQVVGPFPTMVMLDEPPP